MVTSSPPALGLACEPAEEDVMRRDPVEKGRLLLNRLVYIDTLFYGSVIGILSLANFVLVAFVYGNGTSHTSNCNYELTDECEHLFRARAATFATTTLLLLLHAYNCKNLHTSLFKMKIVDNKPLLWSILFGIVTLIPTFYIPVVYDNVFYQAPIDWEWGITLGAALLFVVASELYKAFIRPGQVDKEKRAAAERKRQRLQRIETGGLRLVISSSQLQDEEEGGAGKKEPEAKSFRQ